MFCRREGKDVNQAGWGMGLPLFSLLWQNPRPRINKGKVFAGGFEFCHLFFHKSSHNMRIDLINQTMQIDTGNVGVNAWMFRVISGVRFWHVGDAGNWKTLCLIFREKCGEKKYKYMKLKLVNIWRVVCRCLCAVSVLIILEPDQILKEGDVFLIQLVNFLFFFSV